MERECFARVWRRTTNLKQSLSSSQNMRKAASGKARVPPACGTNAKIASSGAWSGIMFPLIHEGERHRVGRRHRPALLYSQLIARCAERLLYGIDIPIEDQVLERGLNRRPDGGTEGFHGPEQPRGASEVTVHRIRASDRAETPGDTTAVIKVLRNRNRLRR